eukprot:XP_019074376.1 PREDICTED: salicylate carboxymethyltransferase-like [Vitis vinifera]
MLSPTTCTHLNRKPPALQVFLNDLPGNDLNTIFNSLPSFYEEVKKEKGGRFGACFIVGAPGSLYGSLFPNNTMHFVRSSYSSIGCLRPAIVPKELGTGQVMNEGNICIAKTSPPGVFKAYYEQFERDLTLFLESRAEEIAAGGGMLLTVMGRVDPRGEIGLFQSAILCTYCRGSKKSDERQKDHLLSRDSKVIGEEISDDLFARFAKKVIDCMAREKRQYLNLVISLTKKA